MSNASFRRSLLSSHLGEKGMKLLPASTIRGGTHWKASGKRLLMDQLSSNWGNEYATVTHHAAEECAESAEMKLQA